MINHQRQAPLHQGQAGPVQTLARGSTKGSRELPGPSASPVLEETEGFVCPDADEAFPTGSLGLRASKIPQDPAGHLRGE